MNTIDSGVTGRKRPGRAEKVRTKRAASAMATVEELAAALGIGRNQAYDLVRPQDGEPPKVPSLRFGRRYLIPRAVIDKLVGGEVA